MKDYKRQQEALEQGFKKDLLALLKEYNANLEVSMGDNYVIDVDVEIQSIHDDEGNVIQPYTYFELPKYIYGDTKL